MAPYDSLSDQVKNSLTEYYRVDNMEDYDQMVVQWGILPTSMARSIGLKATMNTG